jgi:tetratricopeptide (TPR) repeat protein
MRINFQLIIASIFATQISFGAFAQKFIVNSAAKEINNYNPLDSLTASKKLLAKAKDFIDLAAVNTETSESIQMYMYRGKIYFGLIEVACKESASNGTQPNEALLKEYEEIARTSFNKVYEDPKKKYIPEIQTFLNNRTNIAFNNGLSAYETKNFEMATQYFIEAIEVKSFLNEKYPDAAINAQLSLSLTVDSLIKTKNFDKALELAEVVNKAIPSNIDILILLVNIYLQKGDAIGSEKYLNEALAIDPMNKQLYYVLGTANMDLKENEKAERALSKALEIDSNYNDAQYQLGAHLYNWAVQLKYEAGQLAENDPSSDQLIEKATKMQYRSLALLEKYIIVNPEDKSVLEILRSTYSKLGDSVKAAEYKKRIEALKKN